MAKAMGIVWHVSQRLAYPGNIVLKQFPGPRGDNIQKASAFIRRPIFICEVEHQRQRQCDLARYMVMRAPSCTAAWVPCRQMTGAALGFLQKAFFAITGPDECGEPGSICLVVAGVPNRLTNAPSLVETLNLKCRDRRLVAQWPAQIVAIHLLLQLLEQRAPFPGSNRR